MKFRAIVADHQDIFYDLHVVPHPVAAESIIEADCPRHGPFKTAARRFVGFYPACPFCREEQTPSEKAACRNKQLELYPHRVKKTIKDCTTLRTLLPRKMPWRHNDGRL